MVGETEREARLFAACVLIGRPGHVITSMYYGKGTDETASPAIPHTNTSSVLQGSTFHGIYTLLSLLLGFITYILLNQVGIALLSVFIVIFYQCSFITNGKVTSVCAVFQNISQRFRVRTWRLPEFLRIFN